MATDVATFESMDDHVLCSIFSVFVAKNDYDSDFPTIHRLMLVNKKFYTLLKSPYFWDRGRLKMSIVRRVWLFNSHHTIEPMAVIPKPLPASNLASLVQEWYATFVDVDQETLFELILAADKLHIKPLLDLTCAAVASLIKGKTPEEIRETFNIMNNFTPEEEAAVREENKWCEEC